MNPSFPSRMALAHHQVGFRHDNKTLLRALWISKFVFSVTSVIRRSSHHRRWRPKTVPRVRPLGQHNTVTLMTHTPPKEITKKEQKPQPHLW